ncbi:hypothetical protein [Deinococcus sp.]|uniref:hypothetical protein n=1 Tax=Deinococcus sp. TaxID=47478 RepID=UPI0025E5657B|nr:hypothetical protein [Deinococcus sp.]
MTDKTSLSGPAGSNPISSDPADSAPADSAPAEGQSRDIPAQAQGTGGVDTAEHDGNAEGSRDDGLAGAETSPALDHAKGSGRR